MFVLIMFAASQTLSGIVAAENRSERVPASHAESVSQGTFPDAITGEGWSVSGQLKRYRRDNLFELVNGEADKYLQRGFRELQVISLHSSSGNVIVIELYDQGSLQGSMGMFSEYLSKEAAVESNDEVVFLRMSSGLVGRKGRFFFKIAGMDNSPAIHRKYMQLVAAFNQLHSENTEIAAEYRLLNTALGFNPKFITFQRENVFQFDFVRNFWFAYPTPGENTRVFLHKSASIEKGQQLYRQIVSELGFDYRVEESRRNTDLLWHPFLKNWMGMGRNGAYIFGVENGSDRESVLLLLGRLSRSIGEAAVSSVK